MEGMQANPAQIKKFLKQLTKSREQYLGYLGQLAYQEYLEGNLPVAKLQEVCATIDGIAAQMSKCEQDLAVIEQMKMVARYPRCAYCGNPVPPGSPYCTTCGQPTAPPPPQAPAYPQAAAPAYAPAPAPAYAPAPAAAGPACASCGAPLEADAAFCTTCGQPTAQPAPAPEAPPAPEETPAAPAVEAAPAEAPAPEADPVEAPAPEAPPAPEAAAGTPTCPNCGTANDDPEALFCTECGGKMR